MHLGHDHRGTGLAQRLGAGEADPLAAAGDDRDPALEIVLLEVHGPVSPQSVPRPASVAQRTLARYQGPVALDARHERAGQLQPLEGADPQGGGGPGTCRDQRGAVGRRQVRLLRLEPGAASSTPPR